MILETMDIIKYSLNFIAVPLFAAVWWGFKKHMIRVDGIDKRLTDNERDIAVIEAQMLNIKEDISEIKYGINNLLVLLRK